MATPSRSSTSRPSSGPGPTSSSRTLRPSSPKHSAEMVTNDELFEPAPHVIPGGVNSPVRAFRSVGGTPYFVASAKGSRVTDVEGREYIDYVQSYGASILG